MFQLGLPVIVFLPPRLLARRLVATAALVLCAAAPVEIQAERPASAAAAMGLLTGLFIGVSGRGETLDSAFEVEAPTTHQCHQM